MIEDILFKIGLNNNEIAIYLALLPIGGVPASILGQKTGINRSTAQYTCQQLAKKGLIQMVQKNQTFLYYPESPDKLLYLLEQEKKEVQQKENSIERILGDLKAMINPEVKLPKIHFYEGIKGLIEMFNDVLTEAAPLYGAAILDDQVHPKILTYLAEEYRPKRQKIGNPARMLFNNNKQTLKYRENDSAVNRVSLLLPYDQFPFDSCCHIYANKVAFYSYRKTDLTGVIIENNLVHATQMSLFRLAWDQARTLPINEQNKEVRI